MFVRVLQIDFHSFLLKAIAKVSISGSDTVLTQHKYS